MGKYMRKGKGAGKVAVMEISQGVLGVKTRAKTLALVEHDRKLAMATSASLTQKPSSCVVDPVQTSYLELRSRKLEKVVKENERPGKDYLVTLDSLREDTKAGDDAESTARPAVPLDARIDREGEFVLHAEVVGTSRTEELSPLRVDSLEIFKDFPIVSSLSTPRATAEGAKLRCLEPGAGEEPVRSGTELPDQSGERVLARMAPDGGGFVLEDVLPQDGPNYRVQEVEASCEYAAGECPISPAKKRYFRGSPVTTSSKDREAAGDVSPGSSSRLGATNDRHDRRLSNHRRIMNRRYMRTNLFSDAEAMDGLFAETDSVEREEGKRFTERYNYDVVKDIPLQGRYEWVATVEPSSNTATTQQLGDQHQQQHHHP